MSTLGRPGGGTVITTPGAPGRRLRARAVALAAAASLLLGAALAMSSDAAASHGNGGTIAAVGAENQYADVISQIGGQYVRATAVMSNPSTDPHTFESSPKVSQLVSAAQLVVQNGLGYDTFMTRIESASPSSSRRVVDVQKLLHLPSSTANPHLWYDPRTMPEVAGAIARDLSRLRPTHAAYFHQNLSVFDAGLVPFDQELAKIKADFADAPVATTEPVADYLLQAAGLDNATPWPLQADVMNTTDPSPQDVSIQDALLTKKRVRIFVYNQQVTSTVTRSFDRLAEQYGVPVVGVYETMPTPGYHYQTWMLAEADAIYNALAHGTPSPRL